MSLLFKQATIFTPSLSSQQHMKVVNMGGGGGEEGYSQGRRFRFSMGGGQGIKKNFSPLPLIVSPRIWPTIFFHFIEFHKCFFKKNLCK